MTTTTPKTTKLAAGLYEVTVAGTTYELRCSGPRDWFLIDLDADEWVNDFYTKRAALECAISRHANEVTDPEY